MAETQMDLRSLTFSPAIQTLLEKPRCPVTAADGNHERRRGNDSRTQKAICLP
jgi:hypothetical protein